MFHATDRILGRVSILLSGFAELCKLLQENEVRSDNTNAIEDNSINFFFFGRVCACRMNELKLFLLLSLKKVE